MSDMSHYIFGGISSRRIMINNSYIMCIAQRFGFLHWVTGAARAHSVTHGINPRESGFLGLKRKRKTPVICLVLCALVYKAFSDTITGSLTTPAKWR